MMKLWTLLFSMLIFSASAKALELLDQSGSTGATYKNVAIGIAAPGPGVSMMGHAFILFMTGPDRLSESYSVQFNVDDLDPSIERNLLEKASGFFGTGKRFRVQATPGLNMINKYRFENRPVLLYMLRLNETQISSLWRSLQTEYIRRNNESIADYNFLDRNCLTEALRFINDVLPSEQKFSYIDKDNKLRSWAINLSGAVGVYVRNAPFVAAPTIAKHPLTQGTVVIMPALIAEAKLLVSAQKQAEKLSQLCSFAPDLAEVNARVIARPNLRESQAYLDYLKSIKERCKSDEATQAYGQLIDDVYTLSNSIKAKMLIERYM